MLSDWKVDYRKFTNEELVNDFYWKVKMEPEAVRIARRDGDDVEEIKKETIRVKEELLRRLNLIGGVGNDSKGIH